MGKLIRVNMGQAKVSTGDPGDLAAYGGRGLTSMIVSKEVPPACHALSEMNKLVIAPGLLSGTSAANSGRLSIGAKSPLTGGIKESNVGGNASAKLARLGVRGIVVEGKAEPGKLYCMVVNKDGAELQPADDLKGLKNYEVSAKLRNKHGDKAGVISIGPAGEMKLSAASVAVTDMEGRPSRHAGRGGLGAVMGSKGLKAIVIDDRGAPGVEYADQEAFKAAAKTFREALSSHPVTKSDGGSLAMFGTNGLVNIINQFGAFPTRNFSTGKFEGAEKISGEALQKAIKDRGGKHGHVGCTNCIIHCSNVVVDQKGEHVTSALEYETVWALGANCGIDDLDALARADRMCDELGLDTIETGAAIAVAMEGGVAEFGDAEAMLDLIEEIGKGTPQGRIIGNGAAMTGQAYGVARVPVVKRQAMPAYDPRAVKGVGATYATSPMGADHTAGYAVATNLLGVGGRVDPLKPEGQAELSQSLQIATALLDSAGLCTFVSFAILDNQEASDAIPKMISALTGKQMSPEQAADYAREVLKAEVGFNRGAGFTNKDDRLPEFMQSEKLDPHGVVFDVPDDELDKVHEY